jgi:hypothetical protein
MKLLRAALDDIGLSQTPFTVGIVDTDEAARARRFAGSPAFIVGGTDRRRPTDLSPLRMPLRVSVMP